MLGKPERIPTVTKDSVAIDHKPYTEYMINDHTY
jgi:hypothetical protein